MRAFLAVIALLFSSVVLAEVLVLPDSFAPSPELSKWTAPLGKDWWRDPLDDRRDGSRVFFVSATDSINGSGIKITGPSGKRSTRWFSGDRWDDTATGLEILWQVIHLFDWGTTLNIAKDPEHYYEDASAVFMGRHPSVGRVNIYMGTTALLHWGASWSFPKEYRGTWQWVTIFESGYWVHNNYSIGLRMKF